MKMVKVKTADLIGAQLDFAAAQADGLRIEWRRTNIAPGLYPMVADGSGIFRGPFPYSTCWRFGGPIIERERISPLWTDGPDPEWRAMHQQEDVIGCGSTLLIAAMRAFVAIKLGDEVEVPKVSDEEGATP